MGLAGGNFLNYHACIYLSTEIYTMQFFSISGAQALCHGDSAFGQGTGSILERVNCDGTEPLLINCTLFDYADHYGHCSHNEDAGVRCGNAIYQVHSAVVASKH